ncbi:hypothetical protein [Streptomyces sp. MBT53]|uniref:hypothetical protein n=1 Tax=Streptomyces sp. MBT53 TaxID=1488384 RepID=UPI001F2E8B8A|nr:hypothetical protein [Streptomyces sp. MBT53]
MRPEVQTFVADGPLPDWEASGEEIDRRVEQLDAIPRPVTGEEARALVSCFGADDCYGVAGTLLHLKSFPAAGRSRSWLRITGRRDVADVDHRADLRNFAGPLR